MARLDQPPSRQIVLGFKGVLDFYSWKGVPVVRRWPRKPRQPRSAAVQAQYDQFRFVTQGFKQIQASAMGGLIGMSNGTQLVPKDQQVQLFYGYSIEEANGTYPLIPPPSGDPEAMLNIDLTASQTGTAQNIPVNNTGYVTKQNLLFDVDFSVTSYTHVRLIITGRSNEALQTIDAQVSPQSAPAVPITALGDDLTITSTQAFWDSGWLPITPTILVDTPLQVSLKGSNGSVDLLQDNVRVMFKYEAP